MQSRKYRIIQIILTIIIVWSFGLSGYMAIMVFTGSSTNEFLSDYAIGLSLCGIGLAAVLMTILNKYNIHSTDKGDKFMLFVGIVLILFGLGTILFSVL